jgi:hypothetical protein
MNMLMIVCKSDYVRYGIQFLALASFVEMKQFGVKLDDMLGIFSRMGAGGNSDSLRACLPCSKHESQYCD